MDFPLLLLTIIILSNLIAIPPCYSQENNSYVTCGESYQCANIDNIGYPFWGGDRPDYCGGGHNNAFQLNCQGDVPTITIGSITYRVLSMDNSTRTRTLTLARDDLVDDYCPSVFFSTTFDSNLFSPFSTNQNLDLHYGCTAVPGQVTPFPNQFTCSVNEVQPINYFMMEVGQNRIGESLVACMNNITVPVNGTSSQVLIRANASVADLVVALASGFEVRWTANATLCNQCEDSDGRCGSVTGSNSFTCFCSDGVFNTTCPNGGRSSANTNRLNVVLPVVGAILAGIGFGWLFFFCRQRRKRRIAAQTALTAQPDSKELTMSLSSKEVISSTPSVEFTRSIPSYPSSQSELGIASTYFGAQVFSYAELEEATENFNRSRELGDGGFGTVYYAKLADGREVAVKRLFENNFKRVEQFMNEVNILTRLHHQYLVKLYGCTSKRSRELLLVYEYIPNGTVGDHLNGKLSNSGKLHWPVRLNIAIQTAEALSYLHTSEIIHRDVKTNNILLDDKFSVKVADFGLSRLFPMDQTHVSTAPQGTPGYVDPEYYQCYQLTEKSDVYSFGVVLVELISSLQAVDTNRHRHDINLSNMAVSKIQNQDLDGLVDPGLGFKTDRSVRRMVTLVAELAFRCLQSEKDMRPSMKEVLDTLRGIRDEKAEVVEIIVDDSLPLKSNNAHSSPDLYVTEKWDSSSAPNSSG